ncbi:MAG: DUF134 domain-containing protein [Bacteroidales bacterium]
MSPRTPKSRIIQKAPNFSGFKPFGIMGKQGKAVQLLLEEYEAIKLCDYELFTQEEAAAFMKVSRPTFTRVYERARRKIARAMVETSAIHIGGGKSVVESTWFQCENCKISFSMPDSGPCNCPLCGRPEIKEIL